MIRIKHVPFAAIVMVTMTLAIFAGAFALTSQKAFAAGCQSPSIGFGRWKWCGYFSNKFEDSGQDVRIGGVPGTVNTAQEFINLVLGDYVSGDAHRQAAASFVILTMDGQPLPNPPQSVGLRLISDPNISANWQAKLKGYANISENGSISTGTNGSIDWFVTQHTACGTINSYYQTSFNDIAPYTDDAGNSDCENASIKSSFIIVRDTSGNIVYMIRRACMNPMGTLKALSNPPSANYNLDPSIGTSINGGAGASSAEPGDTIKFTYTVHNSGTTASGSTNCNIYANSHPGFFTTPGTPENTSNTPYTGSAPSCPFTLNSGGTTNVATETITVASGNQTICRSLYVQPATPSGTSEGAEVCITIANKPYVKVFGGDITAGSGLATAPDTCTSNANAGTTAWNQRGSAGFAGAGTQYAALALGTINDFATGQNTAASIPSGLAFANQGVSGTDQSNGVFGGSFGSVPCIPDYYSTMPGTTTPLPSPPTASNLTTGVYSNTSGGQVQLAGGSINPGNRITVFVDGDVYISSNITYTGAWSSDKIPLFELVVRGNIYVGSNVTQLDGVYIAQQKNGSKGIIYTCTDPAAPFTPLVLSNTLYNTCSNKLTVNGSFIANQVQLLRTSGSLKQSSAGETRNASNAAEVFNYNPSVWIAQPAYTSGSLDDYDSITSLPPIL